MKPKFLESNKCYACSKEFTFALRRHHCRKCGRSVCDSCSNKEISIPSLGYSEPVRVCSSCHNSITKFEALDDKDDDKKYDYDVIVIGGGSGGLAFAKEAAKLGKNVLVADYVAPTPIGTTWGLGGTCVNVGCIPKKLMHQAGLLGEFVEDARSFGWDVPQEKPQHSWQKLVEGIQRHIASINLNYVVQLKSEAVKYYNAEAKFVDPHSVLFIQYHPPIKPAYLDKDSKSASQPPEKERDSDSESRESETKSQKSEPKEQSAESKEGETGKPQETDVKTIDSEWKPKVTRKTARRIVIAVGGRPTYPEIPGAKEYAITSDDIFSMKRHPGKEVLVVGASYVALECAGFLTALGCKVTVLVRSILLRGFDQEMASRIGKYMEKKGTKFVYGAVPTKIEKLERPEGKDGDDSFKVTWSKTPVTASSTSASSSSTSSSSSSSSAPERPEGDGVEGEKVEGEKESEKIEERVEIGERVDGEEIQSGIFNTVLLAIGRYPVTKTLNLAAAGVKVAENGKIPIRQEQTNVPHIYALGDVVIPANGPENSLELTPVAIQAGKLLARRLYAKSRVQMNYFTVPTTVFTPIEYGCVGLSEEAAAKRFGQKNLKVYYTTFQPLEFTLPGRGTEEVDSYSYGKIICDKSRGEIIVGFHYLGPNAGEVTQGYTVAIKVGATKSLLDDTVGIHPTNSERMVLMEKSKPTLEEVDEPTKVADPKAAEPEDC